MTRPLPATPEVTGADAVRLHEEILRGTPDTSTRYVMFAQADALYKQMLLDPSKLRKIERIYFYEGKHYWLSNFSSFAIIYAGQIWMTVEHAYQAEKFHSDHSDIREMVRSAMSAHDTKKVARTYDALKREDWHSVKLDIMESLLRTKISTHEYVKRKLLETGDNLLIEDSPTDAFWGRGPDWAGLNHLGRLWMKLRAELQSIVP